LHLRVHNRLHLRRGVWGHCSLKMNLLDNAITSPTHPLK
jgi:hypothetical protein